MLGGISDITANEKAKMNELALFAGAGGGILGGHLLGWRTICAVEWSEFPRESLLRRQRDGALPRFPIWDDVQTFDGRPWAGLVDVVSGGFPCQDISAAGKGAGIDGERSGMWSHMARIIGEVRPRFAFVENSPMLTSRGLGRVLGDLAEMGYDAEWGVLGAIDAGAPHIRERIWIVAHNPSTGWGAWRARRPDSSGSREREYALQEPADMADARCLDGNWRPSERNAARHKTPIRSEKINHAQRCCEVGDANSTRLEKWDRSKGVPRPRSPAELSDWWATEPAMGRVAHGVAHRVDRLRAIGNGQVPAVAAMAFRELSGRLMHAPARSA